MNNVELVGTTDGVDGLRRERAAGGALALAGIVVIAANLRPAITSVGPLLAMIRAETGLSAALAGLMTTLPLLSFGFFSPLVPRLARRTGNEAALAIGLGLLLAGIGIRSVPSAVALFVGTFVVGVGIAVANILLPGLVKAWWPRRIGLMTGLYSTVMTLFAATASGVSVGLAEGLGLGWRGALAFWALPAVAAGFVWAPQVLRARREAMEEAARGATPGTNPEAAAETVGAAGPASIREAAGEDPSRAAFRTLWRSPLAWQVTVFMGLQSFLFYAMVTWLPEMLHSKGMNESTAGWMLSMVQYFGLPTTMLVPMLADRFADQRRMIAAICGLYGVGILALFSEAPAVLYFAVVAAGLGQGSTISLSLTLIGMRAGSPLHAVLLSGMAQSVGYLLAALGPVSLGFVHDVTGSWHAPVAVMLAVGVVMTAAGIGAGRDATVGGA